MTFILNQNNMTAIGIYGWFGYCRTGHCHGFSIWLLPRKWLGFGIGISPREIEHGGFHWTLTYFGRTVGR